MLRVKRELNHILAHHCGKDLKQLELDSDRDNFMTPQQAKEYGIIDTVFEKRGVESKPKH
jgi:ATP-dependent Clp protease protease subunit